METDITIMIADKELHEEELSALVKASSWKFLKEFPFVWVRYEGWVNTPPLIALQNGKIVGFYAAMHLKDTYSNMYYLYTDPSVQGKGIGTKLMHEGILLAQSKGLTRLTWKVLKDNPGALTFYTKLGFLPIAHTENEFVYDVKFTPYIDMQTFYQRSTDNQSMALSSEELLYDTVEHPISKRRRNKYTKDCQIRLSTDGKFLPVPITIMLEHIQEKLKAS